MSTSDPSASAPSTRIEQLVAVLTVLAMVTHTLWLVDLMRLVGARGAFIDLAMFSPVLLLGVRHGRQLLRRESTSLLCVTAYAATTVAWSGHHVDAAVKVMHFAVMLGMVACFRGSEAFVRTVGAASAIASLLIPVYVLGTGKAWIDTRSGLPLLGMAIMLRLHRRATWKILPLLAAVIISTLRASIIGAVAGLSLALLRSWWGRAVVTAAVAGTIAWSSADAAHRPSVHVVEREDIIGRFQTIEDDHASHRFDLWYAIVQDVSDRDPLSREMLVGWGIGDVNYHVADVFPIIAVDQRDHEPMASAHNSIIELCLVGGLVMVPLVSWMMFDVFRFAHVRDMTLPIAVIAACVASANEMFLDLGGGGALIAFVFGTITRENAATSQERASAAAAPLLAAQHDGARSGPPRGTRAPGPRRSGAPWSACTEKASRSHRRRG
jgi:hypothetical protein